MKKRIIILLMFLCLLCGCAADHADTDPLEQVFAALNIDFEEMRLVAWNVVVKELLPLQDLQSLAQDTASLMGLELLGVETEEQEAYRSCTVLAEGEEVQYTIIAQSMPEESYLLICAASKKDIQDFSQIKEQLYKAAGSGSSLHALIIGSKAGERENEILEEELSLALNACGAEILEKASENGFVSCTGYVDSLPEAVLSGKNTVNIQLGADYNEEHDRCYYYIGYPLIFNDY